MNWTAILNFLLIAGALQGLIFNVATIFARKKIEKPVVFLNLCVFFLSLNNLQSWLIAKDFVADTFFLKHFLVPWYVLIVPMFYAFLIYYLEIEKKRMPLLGLAIVIFVLQLIARSVVLILVENGTLSLEVINTYNTFEDALTLVYSTFIFVKAIRVLYKYQELYEPILAFDDLKWVKKFILLSSIIFVLWGIAVLLNIFSETIKAPYSYYPLRLGSSILIYWIGYQAFFRYVMLKDRIVLRKEIRKEANLGRKAKAVTAQEGSKQVAEYEAVHQYILDNQRYFDPMLGLDTLAAELDMSSSKLSSLINQNSGQNFSDYINKLRINDAKNLLSDPNFDAYTIVSIGLECGFNSKSTFYAAFKKFTGQTPTVYRNAHNS